MITTYTINVTKEDIQNGKPIHISKCPVALAITRATGRTCEVDLDAIYVDGLGLVYSPTEVVKFVRAFDDGKNVDPLAFDLTLNYEE
jgi:hypothetical protein